MIGGFLLSSFMHMGMVWTSRDKTLRFYWLLKFRQLLTYPSVFLPWKSCHMPKLLDTHLSPGINVNVTRNNLKVWLCTGSDVVGSLLILSIFYSRQLCYTTCLDWLRFWYVSSHVWGISDTEDVTSTYLTGDSLWCSLTLALHIVQSGWPNQWQMNYILYSI